MDRLGRTGLRLAVFLGACTALAACDDAPSTPTIDSYCAKRTSTAEACVRTWSEAQADPGHLCALSGLPTLTLETCGTNHVVAFVATCEQGTPMTCLRI